MPMIPLRRTPTISTRKTFTPKTESTITNKYGTMSQMEGLPEAWLSKTEEEEFPPKKMKITAAITAAGKAIIILVRNLSFI